jgi:hypothetical protein
MSSFGEITPRLNTLTSTTLLSELERTFFQVTHFIFNDRFLLFGVSARSVINDDAWVQKEFLTTVQDRGAAIIEARKLSSAASAANAVVDHIRDWVLGTAPGEIVSMAVASDGSYGIPKGLVFSYPVTCSGGKYQIVKGLKLDKFSKEKIALTTKELQEEKQTCPVKRNFGEESSLPRSLPQLCYMEQSEEDKWLQGTEQEWSDICVCLGRADQLGTHWMPS